MVSVSVSARQVGRQERPEPGWSLKLVKTVLRRQKKR